MAQKRKKSPLPKQKRDKIRETKNYGLDAQTKNDSTLSLNIFLIVVLLFLLIKYILASFP